MLSPDATSERISQPSSSFSHLLSRSALWTALLVGLLLAASFFPLWLAPRHATMRNDDTYITLTYARSLAEGNGWRFNGGPVTLGTTTPLFAITIAGLARLIPFVPMEYLAVGFSTLCWLATGWLFFLGRRAFGLGAGAATLVALAALLQGGWWPGSLGMEATFLLFGVTLATWLVARRSPLAAGLVSGLLFLIRPEGLGMVPLAAAWLVWQQPKAWREMLPRFLLGAALPLGLWAVYAWSTFGSVLPNSVSAKMGQGTGWPGQPFAVRLVREWLPPIVARYGLSPVLSIIWPLAALGLVYAARRARPIFLLVAWTALYVLAYAVLHAPGYWWYIFPALFTLQLLAGLGLVPLLEQRQRWARALGVVALLLFLGITFHRSTLTLSGDPSDARAPTYLAIAKWLRENTTPGSTVAFVEIGYLGYFTENRIIDLVGLVEPEFTENAAHLDLASNFWRAEPDYLLYHTAFDWLMGEIVNDERFEQRYEAIMTFSGDLPVPITLFQRRDLASSTPP
jgi:MFS family permease